MPESIWGQIEGEIEWEWQEEVKRWYEFPDLTDRQWASFWEKFGDEWAEVLKQRISNMPRIRNAVTGPGAKSPDLQNLDYVKGCFYSRSKRPKGWQGIDPKDMSETLGQVARKPGLIKQLLDEVLAD